MAWHEVAQLEALAEDQPLGVSVGNNHILLCRRGAGVHALDNICTHQFALLSDGYLADGCIECPLHQGRFDITTGAPVDGLVEQPLKVYAARIDGGKVLVELPD
jgi:3-phenylpropionate/trans-cinnamate dioxygenase ferredoxin subunit